MITETKRELSTGKRDISAPVALALGAILVVIGIAGFFAVGNGVPLGVFFVAMPHNVLHLAVGMVLFTSAILGSGPARLANAGTAFLFLTLGIAGVAGVHAVAPNTADTALYLVLGLTLTAAGRLAPR